VTPGPLFALYAVVLTTSFVASRIGPLARQRRQWPWATTVALLVVGIQRSLSSPLHHGYVGTSSATGLS
jgi:hypothetical protein